MEKLIYIFIVSFSFCETTQFMISFMGLDAAKVSIKIEDGTYNDLNAKIITYRTKTLKAFNKLFPVDNYYKTIVTNDLNEILYFEKKTSQPWLNNDIKTIKHDNKILYSDSSIEIPKNYYNIFSLLELLNQKPINEIIKKEYKLEKEGEKYIANFRRGEDLTDVYLDLRFKEQYSKSLLKGTDIFTWAIFKNRSERKLKIKNGKLVYCEFSLGLVNMKAKILDK